MYIEESSWKHLGFPYLDKTILIIVNGISQLHDVVNKHKILN